MFVFPTKLQQYSGPLLVGLVALVFFLLEPMSSELMAYDRYQVQAMQTWRLFTANLLHTNFNHLLLNLAGLLLLWGLHGDHYRFNGYIKIFFLCAVGCTSCIYWFNSDMFWYVGLSGALHGMFAWGACADIVAGLRSGWLLLAGLWVKIGYEQFYGGSEQLATLIDASIAVDAHLFGAICGIAIAIVGWLQSLNRRNHQQA